MLNRRQLLAAAGATSLSGLSGSLRSEAAARYGIAGKVYTEGTVPVVGARVMIIAANGTLLQETRTNRRGNYELPRVGAGLHHLGVAAPGYQFRDVLLSSGGGITYQDFGLLPETAAGAWTTIGTLDPLTGTGPLSGTVLRDGRVFLTADGTTTLLLNPVTGETNVAISATSAQLGHSAALLADGRVVLVGGGPAGLDGGATPGTVVRSYRPTDDSWEEWPGLSVPRLAPTLTRLPKGGLLVIGGIGESGEPLGSCEILDPVTGTSTPAAALPVAVGPTPALMLPDGYVLCTWDVPRLYDARRNTWSDAPPLSQPLRADLEGCPIGRNPPQGEAPRPGDLPDHLLTLLPDGSPAIFGVRRTASFSDLGMVESFDPKEGSWTRRESPRTPRSMPLTVPLPDGRFLAAGGRQEDPTTAEDVDSWCRVPRADLFGPGLGEWRRVADLATARGNHGVALLLPSGEVLVAGGTGDPLSPTAAAGSSAIELFSPPYLARGPRPQLLAAAGMTLRRGRALNTDVAPGTEITDLVLVSARACSRWSDGGAQRTIPLKFRQKKTQISAKLPSSATELPDGVYLLFAMADDVPSKGQIVAITK